MILSAISCDDETGWCRLANPLSGVLRNSVLTLIFLLLLLWSELPVVAAGLIIIGLVFTTYIALRVVPPVQEDSWYARAIFGERLLVCRGWRSVSTAIRWSLLGAKALETAALLGGGWAVLAETDGWALGAFVVFVGARAGQLILTELHCRATVRSTPRGASAASDRII